MAEEDELICFVTTRAHRYTHQRLRQLPGVPRFRIWSYNEVFRSSRLPAATWIFTDLDRLSFWELELAAHVYRQLAAEGMQVLNDPARACHRFKLLWRLHKAGINRFRVWRIDEADEIDRWPVFLRTEASHRGPLTDLITNAGQLCSEIERALATGYPAKDLMVVEYCAEPVRDGLYRKLAVFRVADRLVPTLAVFDTRWTAKNGQVGVAGPELYEQERANMSKKDLDTAVLDRAFAIGEIEYGRMDYALVGESPQVYEINTNPYIGRVMDHPYSSRIDAGRIWEENFVEALHAIDSPSGRAVKISDPILCKQRRLDLFVWRSRWVR